MNQLIIKMHWYDETVFRVRKASEFYGLGVERIASEAGVELEDLTDFLAGEPSVAHKMDEIQAALRTWLKSLPGSISSRISDVVERVGVERAEAACGERVLRWCVGHTQPSLSQLAALLKLANVSADWLLGTGVFAEGAATEEGSAS